MGEDVKPLCAELFCGDLVEQLLESAEGAQEAAHHTSQQDPDKQQKSHHIIGKVVFGGADDGLDRPNGA